MPVVSTRAPSCGGAGGAGGAEASMTGSMYGCGTLTAMVAMVGASMIRPTANSTVRNHANRARSFLKKGIQSLALGRSSEESCTSCALRVAPGCGSDGSESVVSAAGMGLRNWVGSLSPAPCWCAECSGTAWFPLSDRLLGKSSPASPSSSPARRNASTRLVTRRPYPLLGVAPTESRSLTACIASAYVAGSHRPALDVALDVRDESPPEGRRSSGIGETLSSPGAGTAGDPPQKLMTARARRARPDPAQVQRGMYSMPAGLASCVATIYIKNGYKARSQSNFRQNARSQSNFARSQTNFISNCTVLI
eukprot:scaffold5037_cov114-Isochrysis_galbana.AAC.8